MRWIPYWKSHCTSSHAKEVAKELRDSGEYLKVKLGSYLKENGKTYCKIYVITKEADCEQ